jgi:hypothetical protein
MQMDTDTADADANDLEAGNVHEEEQHRQPPEPDRNARNDPQARQRRRRFPRSQDARAEHAHARIMTTMRSSACRPTKFTLRRMKQQLRRQQGRRRLLQSQNNRPGRWEVEFSRGWPLVLSGETLSCFRARTAGDALIDLIDLAKTTQYTSTAVDYVGGKLGVFSEVQGPMFAVGWFLAPSRPHGLDETGL